MAKLVICFTLLFVSGLVHHSVPGTSSFRSGAVAEEFVLEGESSSALFSQCIREANTVEGTLYSVAACEDEEFVRFVPQEKMEFDWVTVDLGPDQGIIECAQKACNSSIYMFKFDGSCKITVDASYDPRAEQGCDSEETEVVYITSRPFNVMDGQIFSIGEFYGCYYSTDQGFTYGEGGKLVSDVELPPPATCCPTADDGYCFLSEDVAGGATFCEAKARCEAKGVPLPTKSFVDDHFNSRLNFSDDFIYGGWLNLNKVDGKWLWMPEMVEFPESNFTVPPMGGDCSAFLYWLNGPQIYSSSPTTILAKSCSAFLSTVLCYEPSTTLPRCPAT